MDEKNKNSKPLAAVYIRVSTEEQVKQGVSLSAQEEALKNYASALGYDVFEIYRDEGKSGKSSEIVKNLIEC